MEIGGAIQWAYVAPEKTVLSLFTFRLADDLILTCIMLMRP